MIGELVMLPVRVGVRATRLWFRALEGTFELTASATGRVIDMLASRSPNGAGFETFEQERDDGADEHAAADPELRAVPEPEREPAPEPEPEPQPEPTERATRATAVAPPVEPDSEPVHVSEEPVLVEEFAEPGAEQGAGAQVRVDPPWSDYQRMSARDVIARLAGADPAELAAVQLYEGMNRRRQTVMNAVERAMRNANAGGSPTNQ